MVSHTEHMLLSDFCLRFLVIDFILLIYEQFSNNEKRQILKKLHFFAQLTLTQIWSMHMIRCNIYYILSKSLAWQNQIKHSKT